MYISESKYKHWDLYEIHVSLCDVKSQVHFDVAKKLHGVSSLFYFSIDRILLFWSRNQVTIHRKRFIVFPWEKFNIYNWSSIRLQYIETIFI